MVFRADELEFLSAWAREEKTTDPYVMPAHRLQADHQVSSVHLIRAIKAWARAEGKRDEEIFTLCSNAAPSWPWSSDSELKQRLDEVSRTSQQARKVG